MIKNKVKEIYESLSVNKYPHVKRVLAFAIKIAKDQGLKGKDLELIEIIALLHDVGYKKQFEVGGKDKHEIYSVEVCREFLENTNFSKEEKEEICETIKTHGEFESCKTQFQKILFDADKLDKTSIGEIIRKSIIMHEGFKMNDQEIFERLNQRMNERKFHFEISKKISKENLKPINEAFKDYKEFLNFADEIEKNLNI